MPRRTFWVDNQVNILVGSGGASNNTSLLTGTPLINVRGATIVRMLLKMAIVSTTIGGAQGVQAVDVGIGIASQESMNAGVLPDPNADERPVGGWMYRTQVVAAQGAEGVPLVYPWEADIRSGRKLSDGEVFMAIANSDILGTAFSIRAVGSVRVLMLLP